LCPQPAIAEDAGQARPHRSRIPSYFFCSRLTKLRQKNTRPESNFLARTGIYTIPYGCLRHVSGIYAVLKGILVIV